MPPVGTNRAPFQQIASSHLEPSSMTATGNLRAKRMPRRNASRFFSGNPPKVRKIKGFLCEFEMRDELVRPVRLRNVSSMRAAAARRMCIGIDDTKAELQGAPLDAPRKRGG